MTFVTFDLHDINIINVEICGGIILFFARFTLSLHQILTTLVMTCCTTVIFGKTPIGRTKPIIMSEKYDKRTKTIY